MKRVAQFDAIVVLGAVVEADGRASRRLRRRVLHGVERLRRGDAEVLILSGGPLGERPTEAEVMHELALAAGLAADRLITEPRSRSTWENARYTAELMAARGWSRVLVVTDWLHLPRALFSFRSTGLRARGSGVRGSWSDQRLAQRLEQLLYEASALVWYALSVPARKRMR